MYYIYVCMYIYIPYQKLYKADQICPNKQIFSTKIEIIIGHLVGDTCWLGHLLINFTPPMKKFVCSTSVSNFYF